MTSPSPVSRLRADVRGRQVVLLIGEYGNPRKQPAPSVAPRLIFAELG